MKEIDSESRFDSIRRMPRMQIDSPIDPEAICAEKTDSDKIRIGKHSRIFLHKFNPDHPQLINYINSKYGDSISWDFMSVPFARRPHLVEFNNVVVRHEYAMPVSEYLQNIDIFLYFTKWSLREAWSRSIAESMTSGCAILANNRFGNKDQVVHCNNGYLCDSLDDFKFGLERLIENPGLIKIMGRNSKLYSRMFSTRRVVDKLLTFIECT